MFDEPTACVDVGAKQEIYSVIGELVAHGAGVIVISSESSRSSASGIAFS